jgi:iron complex outermembrane receptor protein
MRTFVDRRMLVWFLWAVVLAQMAPFSRAMAQHASDNPVVSAEDAFGLTVGLESTGLYNPGLIRGFNPQTAGNARIDGLYFDQQAPLTERVIEGSTIRVGISEVGYAFPAPTGIVDYDLRHATDRNHHCRIGSLR